MNQFLEERHFEDDTALPFSPEIEDNEPKNSHKLLKLHTFKYGNQSNEQNQRLAKTISYSQEQKPYNFTVPKNKSTENDPTKNSHPNFKQNTLPSVVRQSPKSGHNQRNFCYVPGFQKYINNQPSQQRHNYSSSMSTSAKFQKKFFNAMNSQSALSQILSSTLTESLPQSLDQFNFQQSQKTIAKKDCDQAYTIEAYKSPKLKDIRTVQPRQYLQKKHVTLNSSQEQTPQKHRVTISTFDIQPKQENTQSKEKETPNILSLEELIGSRTRNSSLQFKKPLSHISSEKYLLTVPNNIRTHTPQNKKNSSCDMSSQLEEQAQWKSTTSGYKMNQTSGTLVGSSGDLSESALVTIEKANIIKEINEKKSHKDNFYGQFISHCLDISKQEKKSQSKKLFETDLEKLKISQRLLDMIDKQVFYEEEKNQEQSSNNKFKFIAQKKQRSALTIQQKEKLFQVLADSDKIVVHTSQNKELQTPSERKDVVRLAQWLEEMLEKVYYVKELDFLEYFESVQLICSSCMSELIRQVGMGIQERGMLIKKVWESLLNLMKQAFEQVSLEKFQKEKDLQDELKKTHRMYLAKLDDIIPQVATLQRQLENKELQNKRVVLEFRYLRKKDSKLEKYLKLTKKDLRTVEEEYINLQKELLSFKAQILSMDKKGDLAKRTSKIELGIEKFNKNYDKFNEEIRKVSEQYKKDVRNLHSKSRQSFSIQDEIEEMEEQLYSNQDEAAAILQIDQRIIEEIEGDDGIKLIIGHCSTQTYPDLLKMTHQSIDTSQLFSCKDKGIQTHTAVIDVKEVQTEAQWDEKGKVMEWDNQQETVVVGNNNDIEKMRQQVEKADEKLLERIKIIQTRDDEEENESTGKNKVYSLSVVKAFLEDQDLTSRQSLIGSWKNEEQSSSIFNINSDLGEDIKDNESGVKIKESIYLTLQNKEEKDLEELQLLVLSSTNFMISMCEKILEHNLLKENLIISPQSIKQFIEDNKVLVLEENSRFKNIWQKSNLGLFERAQSKIEIAEKDLQIQEEKNDKVVFQQQIKQIKQSMTFNDENKYDEKINYFNIPKITTVQMLESQENNSEESEISSDSETLNDDEIEAMQQSLQYDKDNMKVDPQLAAVQRSSLQNNKKGSLIIPSVAINNKKFEIKPRKSLVIPQQQSQPKKSKKKETLNPLNRISVSLIEAIQQKQPSQQSPNLMQSEDDGDKRYFPINRQKNEQQGNAVQHLLRGFSFSKSGGKDSSLSPNADSAALFFNKVVIKYLNTNNKIEGKRMVLKQQIVLKHIQSIYLEKVKSLKTSISSNSISQGGGTLQSNQNNQNASNSNNNQNSNNMNNNNNNNNNNQNDEELEEEFNVGEESQAKTLNLQSYDYFINQFGFKKLAETKLKQFLESCGYYSGVSARIRTFTKLYGFNRVTNYDFEDFDFFGRILKFLEEGANSQQIAAGIIPLNRAMEALVKRFEGKIDITKFKQELESIKSQDSTQKIKNKFAVESDAALDIFLSALVEEKKLQMLNIRNSFIAADIDSDDALSLDEFLTLLRHIEAKQYNHITGTKLFMQNCDLVDMYTNTHLMSFSSFALASLHQKLFSKRSQESFLAKVDQFDAIYKPEVLSQFWADKKDVIRIRFVKNSAYSISSRLMIKKIDDFLSNGQNIKNPSLKNQIWFTYRLLDEESKRVMADSLVSSYLPIQFINIAEQAQTLVKNLSSPISF